MAPSPLTPLCELHDRYSQTVAVYIYHIIHSTISPGECDLVYCMIRWLTLHGPQRPRPWGEDAGCCSRCPQRRKRSSHSRSPVSPSYTYMQIGSNVPQEYSPLYSKRNSRLDTYLDLDEAALIAGQTTVSQPVMTYRLQLVVGVVVIAVVTS